MSLAEFQFIYWWEWAHRFLGRVIGVAFAIPFITFAFAGYIRRDLAPSLIALFALGALQGFMGWYMVQSGLVDRVSVSQYRLAAHLGLAAIIYAAMIWVMLGVGQPARARGAAGLGSSAAGLLVLSFAQIVLGAFVAGMKAGLAYNTWPLMNGAVIPDGLFVMQPWHLNLFENALTVQFNHRIGAYLLFAWAIAHAAAMWRSGHTGTRLGGAACRGGRASGGGRHLDAGGAGAARASGWCIRPARSSCWRWRCGTCTVVGRMSAVRLDALPDRARF